MRLVETFLSIDGEGKRAGQLTTFARFAGCNLQCSYCDTSYAQNPEQGEEKSLEDVAAIINGYGCSNITLTGGEPMLHEQEILKLCTLIVHSSPLAIINIETNGSIDLTAFLTAIYDADLWDNVFLTVDYKSISSGMNGAMQYDMYQKLRDEDVIKCVVGSVYDMDDAVKIMSILKPEGQKYFSPIWGRIAPSEIVEYMKHNCLYDWKIQLQMHKIIWDPELRGV